MALTVRTDTVIADSVQAVFKLTDGTGWVCVTLLGPLPLFDVFTHAERRGELNQFASVNVDRMHMDDFGTLQGGELRGFRPWI